MDRIVIENVEVYARHGVFPEETRLGQRFYVNAVLYLDTRRAGISDELEHSTNYGEVCCLISDFLQEYTYKLLEAAAEHLAEKLLLTFPLVERLELEIRKPSAPIPVPFSSVSVRIERGWRRALIACGSNLGDKESYIKNALQKISEDEKCRMESVSDLIVTEPYGEVEQDDFLNGAFVVRTLYTPQELLAFLNRLEAEADRVREIHWGPRTLDLDIILYEDQVIRTDSLTIPHADMQNRRFVLEPASQIAPEWIHPIYGKSLLVMKEELR